MSSSHGLNFRLLLIEKGRLIKRQGFAGAEELSLFVTRVFLAFDVNLLIVLDDAAGFAHFFNARTNLHLN